MISSKPLLEDLVWKGEKQTSVIPKILEPMNDRNYLSNYDKNSMKSNIIPIKRYIRTNETNENKPKL
jgi:hypothetical protein